MRRIPYKGAGSFTYSGWATSEEGMVNAFGLIYAIPSYVLDHSESAARSFEQSATCESFGTQPFDPALWWDQLSFGQVACCFELE